MDIVFLIARLLFVPLLVVSGLGHLRHKDMLAGFARSAGAPASDLMVPLSGVAMIAGAVALALGVWVDLAALGLILTLIPITWFMHAYWKIDDPQERSAQQVHFNKNIAVIGGLLVLFWLYAEAVDLPLSLTDGVF